MATLAEALRGYTPPTESALADPIKQHFANLPQTTAQNLAKQRQDIDAALQMTPEGMQIADQGAFNRFMGEVPNVAALTAWHGTPHQIKGAFDISKVGTGEGAQAYGYGMYFAENPAVAGEYARALAEKPKDVINGYINYSAKYGRPKGEGNTSLGYLQSQGFPIENAPLLDKIIAGANVDKQGNVNFSSSAIKELSNLESAMASKGNLYKVDIPDEQIPKMIDFDKPLQDQPKDIQNWVINKDPEASKTMFTGATLRKYLTSPDTSKQSAEELLAMGYKGIRYLDEGSRGKPYAVAIFTKKGPYAQSEFATKEQAEQYIKEKQTEGFKTELKNIGTSNFVVFDPSTVKILEENSKPFTRKELIEQQVNKVLE
jgi:hypothetical protein